MEPSFQTTPIISCTLFSFAPGTEETCTQFGGWIIYFQSIPSFIHSFIHPFTSLKFSNPITNRSYHNPKNQWVKGSWGGGCKTELILPKCPNFLNWSFTMVTYPNPNFHFSSKSVLLLWSQQRENALLLAKWQASMLPGSQQQARTTWHLCRWVGCWYIVAT